MPGRLAVASAVRSRWARSGSGSLCHQGTNFRHSDDLEFDARWQERMVPKPRGGGVGLEGGLPLPPTQTGGRQGRVTAHRTLKSDGTTDGTSAANTAKRCPTPYNRRRYETP